MTDEVFLGLRLWLAVVMVAHGYHHARSLPGTARWFASKGFRYAKLLAGASAIGEVAIGVGLAVGLLTSIAAAGLVATMTVAFSSIHRFAGFFVFKRPDEGWEYVATLAAVATAVAAAGPGRYSIDSLLEWDGALDGWIGLVLVLGGVVMAVASLAATWRKPG